MSGAADDTARRLLRDARRAVVDVDRSLAALEAGAWGRCDACGSPIGAARLEVRPMARTCVACAH